MELNIFQECFLPAKYDERTWVLHVFWGPQPADSGEGDTVFALSLQGPGGGEVREGAGANCAQGWWPDRDEVRVLTAPIFPPGNLLDFTQGLGLSEVVDWAGTGQGVLDPAWCLRSGSCIS